MNSKERALGMDRAITRRDFLNGVALTIGASAVPSPLWAALEGEVEKSPDYYPPALTGLRGSHPGSFEVAHKLRDGIFWNDSTQAVDTGETYDLVIVGGGISGLSAAHYFRKAAGANARILIIENHDDIGGHAKRNELRARERRLLGYGGTFSIESPAPYSPISKALLAELGIDVAAYPKYVSKDLYPSFRLAPKVFFDKETFGVDRLVLNPLPLGGGETRELRIEAGPAWKQFMAEAPLAEKARQDIVRLHQDRKDYFPGLSSEEKKAKLARISYARFLTEVAGAHSDVVRLFQAGPHSLFGLGIDAVSAQDAWGLGYPGFLGMNLDPKPGRGMNRDAIPNEEAEKYFFHFPDGNASVARLLVRQLIPGAIPGTSATDIVTARANYAKFDQSSSRIRIRLNSTAVRVKHLGDPARATQVEVAYARRDKVYTVKASHCILACWHMMIPYICDDLPEAQKAALSEAAKVPLLYTNVALANWSSFQRAGTNLVYAPGSYHTHMNLDLPVSMGDYHCSLKPEDPIILHMSRTPCRPGRPAREQHRLGRMELFITPFDTIERHIRQQLARTLSDTGFDPARDITAITANRWPHGYAYEYNSLWDDFWLKGETPPCEIARQSFGRLAIANADADAYAYTDCAIDQAYRAVQEITKNSVQQMPSSLRYKHVAATGP